jgi:spore germination cell wall hydrolase CwlJ-like protein
MVLLLRRSPETAFERAMLMQRLRSRRVVLSVAAGAVLLALAAAAAAKWSIDRELECLALNVYFEARGEPLAGQVAVAHVVMNRSADPRFPGNVCDVVRQGGKETIDCQFSWWCDEHADRPTHMADWQLAKEIARTVYWSGAEDPTGGALWYHAVHVRAYWRGRYQKGPVIGRHIFYRDKAASAQPAAVRKKYG